MDDFKEVFNNGADQQMPQAPINSQPNSEQVTEEAPPQEQSFEGAPQAEAQEPVANAENNQYQQPPFRPPYQNPYPQPQPQQRSNYQQQPYGYNPYAQQNIPYSYYQQPYQQPKPEKEKMSGGLKALVIIVISILVACLIGLTMYLGFSTVNNQNNNPSFFENYQDFGGNFEDYFNNDTIPTLPQEENQNNAYPESNASDKVNKNFKGLVLEEEPKDAKDEKYKASYSFEKLQDSVVGVVCYLKGEEESYESQGTGIIVTSDGYIVTNSHVINNSRSSYLIKVITSDKKEYKAGVVGYDSRSDIAVLKIDGKNFPAASFGDSDYVDIAQDIITIGNPNSLEFQNSVTKGIVSALDRKVSTTNNVKFIQIDAAINPGNSGGPLCNLYGQVIGITTSKIASEIYEGMGFAIPSATVKAVVDDIIRYGYVTNRVKIGITGFAVNEATAGATGIQIEEIVSGGPMDNTDAQNKDIITAVDGVKISTFAEVYDILEKHKEGDKVKITLYRPSTGKTFEVEIALQIDKAE